MKKKQVDTRLPSVEVKRKLYIAEEREGRTDINGKEKHLGHRETCSCAETWLFQPNNQKPIIFLADAITHTVDCSAILLVIVANVVSCHSWNTGVAGAKDDIQEMIYALVPWLETDHFIESTKVVKDFDRGLGLGRFTIRFCHWSHTSPYLEGEGDANKVLLKQRFRNKNNKSWLKRGLVPCYCTHLLQFQLVSYNCTHLLYDSLILSLNNPLHGSLLQLGR